MTRSSHDLDFDPEQEREAIPQIGKVVVTVIISALLTVISIVIAWRLDLAATPHHREAVSFANAPPPPPPPNARSTVERTLFIAGLDGGGRGEREQAMQRRALEENWEWSDRDAGLAHIPIDRAMEIYLQQQQQQQQQEERKAP